MAKYTITHKCGHETEVQLYDMEESKMKITNEAIEMSKNSEYQTGDSLSPEDAQRLLDSNARYIVDADGMTDGEYPIPLFDAYYSNADSEDIDRCQTEGMTPAEIYDTWDLALSDYTLPYILDRDFICIKEDI
jgi:hypothetical protein